VNEADLFIVNACCCANLSFYPAIPQCIGCSTKVETCCAVAHCCCKCGTRGLGCRAFGNSVCIQCGLPCVAAGCKYPTVCIKTQVQLLCAAESCALPGDKEIPTACALLFVVCYPRCTCCLRLSDARQGGGAPSAPDFQQQKEGDIEDATDIDSSIVELTQHRVSACDTLSSPSSFHMNGRSELSILTLQR